MSNQEILTKAIEKAIENGWRASEYQQDLEPDVLAGIWEPVYEKLIYSKDFAKALWGEEYEAYWVDRDFGDDINNSWKVYAVAWQFHLQQMVISEDPIKYLGENL